MPYDLNTRRLGAALQKLLGLVGYLPMQVEEAIAATLSLGELDPFLREEFPFGADTGAAAVAGQFGFVALVNPLGSGILVKVDVVTVVAGGPTAVGLTNTALAVGALAQVEPDDSRLTVVGGGASASTAAQVRAGTNAVKLLNTGIASTVALSTGAFWRAGFDSTFIVAPGTSLVMEAETVNTAVRDVVHWREVVLAPQELKRG